MLRPKDKSTDQGEAMLHHCERKMVHESHNRKELRIKGYNYSLPGGYFVTICTFGRKQSLGKVVGSEVQLSKLGRLVESTWIELPSLFDCCALMEYVIMPNHLHGIIVLEQHPEQTKADPKGGTASDSLGSLIQACKSRVTRLARRSGVWSGPVWQRGYYDHVIRNDGDLENIQEYILNNPLQWQFDQENLHHGVEAKPSFAPGDIRNEPWAKHGFAPTRN